MEPQECQQLKQGTLVRHKIKKYVGFFDGTTSIQDLFESPTDTLGCRVAIAGQEKRLIASPTNLENLDALSVEERHRISVRDAGQEWKGAHKISAETAARRPYRPCCWRCRSQLDNAIDWACNECGWLLCRCGACGCGYHGKEDTR